MGLTFGAPSSAYPGAAGQPGHWNSLSAGSFGVPLDLLDLSGAPGGANLSNALRFTVCP